MEISLFDKLKIKEVEEACYEGWKVNLSEEQLLGEIYKALERDPYNSSKSLDTIFLDGFPSVETLSKESRDIVTSHLKSKKMDIQFQFIWDQSSIKAEINEERRKLLHQWHLINIKENTEKSMWIWDHERIKEMISDVLKELSTNDSSRLIDEITTRMTAYSVLVRTSFRYQQDNYESSMKNKKKELKSDINDLENTFLKRKIELEEEENLNKNILKITEGAKMGPEIKMGPENYGVQHLKFNSFSSISLISWLISVKYF